MTDTIPDWAGKRACELLNERASFRFSWPKDAYSNAVCVVAKLVMQHEQPPVDPDEEAVKRIVTQQTRFGFAAAVSQYKQEKGNG